MATAVQSRPFPHVEGVTHRHVDAAGLRMHIAEAGAGEPLLMLHGWPQHWYMWRHQIPALAERYRLIIPDMRGFGWSDAPPRGYEKQNLATDFLNLLDALDLERVRLMGHDWGGWCGFLMCMRAPERFERLLALNIPPPWGGDPTPRNLLGLWRSWYQVVNASPLGGWLVRQAAVTQWAIRGTATHPENWSDAELAQFTDQFTETDHANASVQLYRTFITREMPALLARSYIKGRLVTPTRLLFGVSDFAIPKSTLEGDHARHADDFVVELVEDTGHFIAEERPELVTERALEFFAA